MGDQRQLLLPVVLPHEADSVFIRQGRERLNGSCGSTIAPCVVFAI
jgi:hypothetical protein